MMASVTPESAMATLYDADFAAWTEEQAAALRRLAAEHPELTDRLDLANLIEECPFALDAVLAEGWLPE
jgi:hypothetical protein